MANEVVIPPDIKPDSGEKVTLLDDQTVVFRPQFGRQWTQRNSFGDPRWVFERTYTGARSADRSRLAAALQSARGKFRVIMLSPAQEPRGTWASVAGGELTTNADFSDGTTGWSSTSANVTRTVTEGVYRGVMIRDLGSSSDWILSGLETVNQYAPHVLRMLIRQGRYSGTVRLLFRNSASSSYVDNLTTITSPVDGYYKTWVISFETQLRFGMNTAAQTGPMAGDHMLIPFVSGSQCMLIDGGGNRLLQASTITNASWTKTNASASAVGGIAPDGVADAEALIENSSLGSHAVTQSGTRASGATWISGFVEIKQRTGDRWLRMFIGNNGTDCGAATFNLTGGSASSISNAGAATDCRAKIVNLGNGWWRCYITVYCPSASTIFMQANMATNAGATSYTGDGSSSLYMRALTAYPSGSPSRGDETTTVAIDSSSQSGANIYVKGLPESQSELLLPGDWVEIDGQLKQVTASLNSDAAGLGMLEVRPQVAREVADNTPVIVTKPMGRFILANDAAWNSRYGLYADYNLKFEEVYE